MVMLAKLFVLVVMLASCGCRPRPAKPPTLPAGKRLVNPLRRLAPEQLEEVLSMNETLNDLVEALQRAARAATVRASALAPKDLSGSDTAQRLSVLLYDLAAAYEGGTEFSPMDPRNACDVLFAAEIALEEYKLPESFRSPEVGEVQVTIYCLRDTLRDLRWEIDTGNDAWERA